MPGFNFKLCFWTTYYLFLTVVWTGTTAQPQKCYFGTKNVQTRSLTQHQPQACYKKLPAKQQRSHLSPSNASSDNFTMIVGTSARFSSKAVNCFFWCFSILSVWLKCLHRFQRNQQRASWRAISSHGEESRALMDNKNVEPLHMMWELPGVNGGAQYTCSCTISVRCVKECPTWCVQHLTPSSWSV